MGDIINANRAEWDSGSLTTRALNCENYDPPAIPQVAAMITVDEQRFLSCAAERIWDLGAMRDGLIIDAGCFAGASTVALATGLARSSLSEAGRSERIWSYDTFVTTPGMAQSYFQELDIQAGESFRQIFDRNVQPFRDSIRVHHGDIRGCAVPNHPVALLFVDMLWSWDVTAFVHEHFCSRLEAGRSLLVHQDFVYPYYPWVILNAGLSEDSLRFARHVQYSSVVFDVQRTCRSAASADGRDIGLDRALMIYDGFIDRVDGWAKGALALGKALYLASRNELDRATRLIDEVESKLHNEPLVMQYVPSIRYYAQDAAARGAPVPLDTLSGQ
jgi:hypothetical protein